MHARSIVFAALSIPAALAASGARADVTISSAGTQNMACSNGVCAPTASDAVLNVGDLENLLAAGNVEVTTTGAGVQAKDIKVNASLNWSTASVLALNSHGGIAVDRPVDVLGTGGVVLTTGGVGRGGVLLFGEHGHISFANLTSPLTINGSSYVLVNSIASLASAANANLAGAYALAENYDASKDGAYGNAPVFENFSGSFEGLGNTIAHFKIRCKSRCDVGLFDSTVPGASVAGLIISNMDAKIEDDGFIGGIVADNWGLITNCHVSGRFEGASAVAGGIAGVSIGAIANSSANVRIDTSTLVGGLVGTGSGNILRSYAEGSISCGGNAGTCMYAGGLVGDFGGATRKALISESFATNTISGNGTRYGAVLGGLVGIMDGSGVSSQVSDSYATGAVSGDNKSFVGGLINEDVDDSGKNLVSRSYATGAVTVQNGGMAGGFDCEIGPHDAKLDYWDTTTSGTTDAQCGGLNISGVTGLTTTQLQSGLPIGFNPKVWKEDPNINNGFPYLINNPPPK